MIIKKIENILLVLIIIIATNFVFLNNSIALEQSHIHTLTNIYDDDNNVYEIKYSISYDGKNYTSYTSPLDTITLTDKMNNDSWFYLRLDSIKKNNVYQDISDYTIAYYFTLPTCLQISKIVAKDTLKLSIELMKNAAGSTDLSSYGFSDIRILDKNGEYLCTVIDLIKNTDKNIVENNIDNLKYTSLEGITHLLYEKSSENYIAIGRNKVNINGNELTDFTYWCDDYQLIGDTYYATKLNFTDWNYHEVSIGKTLVFNIDRNSNNRCIAIHLLTTLDFGVLTDQGYIWEKSTPSWENFSEESLKNFRGWNFGDQFDANRSINNKFMNIVVKDANYTGKPIENNVSITYYGYLDLIKDQEYELFYSNNIQPGKATVTIKGKTPYSGEITKTFYIKKDFPFIDVSPKEWYYNTITEVNEIGLMTGTDSTHFSPDKPMSRGMVATVLYRMAGAPNVTGKSKFSDVKDGLWYSKAITWAANSGIISGYQNGKFGPDDNVTREQMSVMLRNYAMKRGLDTKTTNNLKKFKDYKNVTNYAKSAMGWAVDKGIISGANNGTRLNPTSNATRAECAKMLLQFYKLK